MADETLASGRELCLLPVAAPDALAWAEGRLQDRDLVLRAPLRPEAVFIVNLPGLAAYRSLVRQAAVWRRQGAICLIARTGTPAVASHLARLGAIPVLKELTSPVKCRWFLPPEAFTRWLRRIPVLGTPKAHFAQPES